MATLTEMYEELRHCEDSDVLSKKAHEPLPDREEGALFSRAATLLEAVAGNIHTPVEDRIFLATHIPFPNVLVALAKDPESSVREAVAKNPEVKNYVVGRLTKDESLEVRTAALLNPQTSWKMRLDGAMDPQTTPQTLGFLSRMGIDEDKGGPAVLAEMVRRAVALNPSTPPEVREKLAQDESRDVRNAVEKYGKTAQTQ